MNIIGGELFNYLDRQVMVTEAVARFYLAEIILALEFIHESNIIYRYDMRWSIGK